MAKGYENQITDKDAEMAGAESLDGVDFEQLERMAAAGELDVSDEE
jgi:hypothetical protein